MKPNFTTSFLIVYLLYLQNSSADIKSYTISCSTDQKTCMTDKSMTQLTNSSSDGIIPCICPSDKARVIYYICDKNNGVWETVDVSKDPYKNSNTIDQIIKDNINKNTGENTGENTEENNSVSNGCYACGKGNFLVGTKCHSCANATEYEGATTEEVAVAGIHNCIIPEGDDTEYSDDKGKFKYMAQCAFTCTNSNDALCKSNT